MIELKSKPALVIIDMQNGFCHPEGTFGKLGMPVTNHLNIVPTINKLRKQSHASNIPVFFTRLAFKEDYSDAGVQWEDQPQMREMRAFIKGTWDAQILDDLEPDANNTNEVVVDKARNTPFWHTDLDHQLRSRAINQLLFTGVGTNVCVESAVRDAITNDYYCRTISDATATLSMEEHEASLRNLNWFGGVATAEEVLAALRAREKHD
ncbi:hypothetical protein MMC10_000275 [Thelotrema lepadinum]|nr:hypothetical protein [Thelotrema lepadinum]